MLKKGFFVLLVFVLSLSIVFAYAPKKSDSYKGKPMTPQKFIGPNLPEIDGMVYYSAPFNTDDIVGDAFEFGTTWYDIQHNCTCGHQLSVDPGGWVHLGWMNGLQSGATDRHIFYQLMDADDNLQFTTPNLGVQVDQMPRAGYTTSIVADDNRSMITFHQGQGGTNRNHTAVAWDYFPRMGAFSTVELPWVYEFSTDMEVIWPKCAMDIDGRLHILSTENPASGVAGDPQRHYYGWADYDALTYTMTTCEEQELMTWTMLIGGDIACSPVSNRAAVVWSKMNATDPTDTTQHDNDVILCISEDGMEWDWTDTVNVSNWIEFEDHLLPDTLLANKDTLRLYCDINVFFDYNDICHVIFTTEGYYHYSGAVSWGNGFIWHWSEEHPEFSMVANGWFDNGFYDPGAWNTYTQRASAAVDQETGDIYCMYQRLFQPTGPSLTYPYPYQVGDTTDWSAAGWPNGEIWATKSTNGGYSWAEGINVTNTRSPNQTPGNCRSEITPSAAPQIADGYFHFFYVLDTDAGAVVQDEGTWSDNSAVYHRVLLEEIPESPRLMPYPMHVDSTGLPEDTVLAITGNGYTNVPKNFNLQQNYPNPFNPATSIRYELNRDCYASLKVYNIHGREVATLLDGYQSAGVHEAVFDASDLSSGVYFYRLAASGYTMTKKMLLMK